MSPAGTCGGLAEKHQKSGQTSRRSHQYACLLLYAALSTKSSESGNLEREPELVSRTVMMVVVGAQVVEIGLNAGMGGASGRPFPPQPDRPAIILPPVSSH